MWSAAIARAQATLARTAAARAFPGIGGSRWVSHDATPRSRSAIDSLVYSSPSRCCAYEPVFALLGQVDESVNARSADSSQLLDRPSGISRRGILARAQPPGLDPVRVGNCPDLAAHRWQIRLADLAHAAGDLSHDTLSLPWTWRLE